jgi:hypothetical protein
MDVTRYPHPFNSTPMLLAVTPLPSPLTTPPVTRTYFTMAITMANCAAIFGRLAYMRNITQADGVRRAGYLKYFECKM